MSDNQSLAGRLQAALNAGVRVCARQHLNGTLVTLEHEGQRLSRWHTDAEQAIAYALDAYDQGWWDAPESRPYQPVYAVVIVHDDGAVDSHEMPRDAAYALVLDELDKPTDGTESVSIRPVG